MKTISLFDKRKRIVGAAIVDDCDYEALSKHHWSMAAGRRTAYASRYTKVGGRKGVGKSIRMHREIMGIVERKDLLVDHIDGNGLNNSRNNLRVCNAAQNAWNTRMHTGNKSGYKGVTFQRSVNRWQAAICKNGKIKYLGCYDTPLLAHEAYVLAANAAFGEFARP